MTVPRLGDRSLFPLLEPRAYLNHAGVSPPSEPVRLAVHEAVDDFARRGGDAVGAAVERRERLRARIAELLGAAPADVALTTNTSTGIQAVALDFPWRRGDRVVLLDGEFPANVTPWQQAAGLHSASRSPSSRWRPSCAPRRRGSRSSTPSWPGERASSR